MVARNLDDPREAKAAPETMGKPPFPPSSDPGPTSRPEASPSQKTAIQATEYFRVLPEDDLPPARGYEDIDAEIDEVFTPPRKRIEVPPKPSPPPIEVVREGRGIEDAPSADSQFSRLPRKAKLTFYGIVCLAGLFGGAFCMLFWLTVANGAPLQTKRVDGERDIPAAEVAPAPRGEPWLPNKPDREWRILYYCPSGREIRVWYVADFRIYPSGWVEAHTIHGEHVYVKDAVIEPAPLRKGDPRDNEFAPVKRRPGAPPADPAPLPMDREPVPDPNK